MGLLDGIDTLEALGIDDRAIGADDVPWVPQAENVWFKPLRFDFASGRWINVIRMVGEGVVNRHRHTGGQVIGYCLKGSWRYLEHDWVARPGTLIWEPPGDVHTLTLDGVVLEGIRWDDKTRWPADWQERIRRASTPDSAGVLVIRSWPCARCSRGWR